MSLFLVTVYRSSWDPNDGRAPGLWPSIIKGEIQNAKNKMRKGLKETPIKWVPLLAHQFIESLSLNNNPSVLNNTLSQLFWLLSVKAICMCIAFSLTKCFSQLLFLLPQLWGEWWVIPHHQQVGLLLVHVYAEFFWVMTQKNSSCKY